MNVKTLFLSDLHLGTRACKTSYLKDFLKNVEAETIYLVGDIIDGWALKGSWFWSPEMNDIVRLLLKKSKKSKVYYIAGNHDEMLREFIPLGFGNIEVVNRAEFKTADGKKMVILHGDIFDAFVSSKVLSMFGSALYDLIIWANNVHHFFLNKFGMKYWSLAEWVKSHTKEAVRAIERFETTAATYAKGKGFDSILCGHIHHTADKEVDGVRYLNCGDWVSSCTAIVEELDGRVRILDYKQEMLD